MNIIILIDTLNFGGAEKQVVLDANALINKTFSVCVAFFKKGPLEKELNGRIKRIHIRKKSYLGRITSLISILKSNKIDLIHSHMFKAEIVAAIAGKISGTQVILNEHGLGLWRRRHHIIAFRLATQLADEVFCASDASRYIRNFMEKIPAHKIRTVYNSFVPFLPKKDGQSGAVLRKKIVSSLKINSENCIIIGFVGRFDAVKQLHLFVELAQKFRDQNVVFVLVGDGNERDRIQKAIADKELSQKFYLPGFVHEPKEFYELFDIFVLPSKRESLSLSLIEAGGCGLPGVAFNVGGNREIISDRRQVSSLKRMIPMGFIPELMN